MADQSKDLAYYLTLFKIEGHTTWRAHLGSTSEAFDKQMMNDHHKVTEVRAVRIDRIEGNLRPLP